MYILMYKREEIAFMHIIKSFHFFVFSSHAYISLRLLVDFKQCFSFFFFLLFYVILCVSIWLCVVGVLLVDFIIFFFVLFHFSAMAVCAHFFHARTRTYCSLSLDKVLLLLATTMAIITFLFIHMSSTVHFICRMCVFCICMNEMEMARK